MVAFLYIFCCQIGNFSALCFFTAPAQFGKDRLQIFHQRNFLTECGSNQKIRAGKFCFCRLAVDDFKFLFRYTDGNIFVSDSQRITPLLLFFNRGAGLARIKCAGRKATRSARHGKSREKTESRSCVRDARDGRNAGFTHRVLCVT